MEMTLGKRIAALRHQKELKQDELAEKLGVSPQAVSKWENDQTCPDISLLPQLAQELGISVDELLTGHSKTETTVCMASEENRKDISQMMLRVVVDSTDGDRVRINLPMALVQVTLEMGMNMPQISGNNAMKNIDWSQILELVRQGVTGNLVEVESDDGDTVRIFVE